jgi:excisionase family DNA binding protein
MSNYLFIEEDNTSRKVYLTLKELADYTGLSISTLYKYSSSGRIPTYKPFGKQVFIKIDEIAQIFEESRSSSNAELESKAEALSFRNPSIA